MKHTLAITFAALMLSFNAPVGADAALTYELSSAGDSKTVKQFSMARFFVRIDNPAEKDQYLLFQAGKFFPLFSVDQANNHQEQL